MNIKIPPAYTNVYIYEEGNNNKILAYGYDNKNRKQFIYNAEYIKKHFLDTGRTGLLAGKGYYEYPNPTYQQPNFLDIPEKSAVPALAAKAKLT